MNSFSKLIPVDGWSKT